MAQSTFNVRIRERRMNRNAAKRLGLHLRDVTWHPLPRQMLALASRLPRWKHGTAADPYRTSLTSASCP